MLPSWRFLLDRGVNFRTKHELLIAGFPEVLQLADVGLTGLAKDPEIFAEALHRRFILITKDTDFIRQQRYAIGHGGILYIVQSRTELRDIVSATLALAGQYASLANMRFAIEPGGKVTPMPPHPQQRWLMGAMARHGTGGRGGCEGLLCCHGAGAGSPGGRWRGRAGCRRRCQTA